MTVELADGVEEHEQHRQRDGDRAPPRSTARRATRRPIGRVRVVARRGRDRVGRSSGPHRSRVGRCRRRRPTGRAAATPRWPAREAPAPGHPAGRRSRAEQRAGDDTRRDRDEEPEEEGVARGRPLSRRDRGEGAGVRRHEAVQHREAGEGGDPDLHQRRRRCAADTRMTTGTRSTTPTSKNSGSPRIAAISGHPPRQLVGPTCRTSVRLTIRCRRRRSRRGSCRSSRRGR